MTRWFLGRTALGFRGRSALAAVALSALLPFAGTALAEEEGLNLVDPDRGFSQVEREYPEMDEHYSREGTPPSLAEIRSLAVGATKDEVQRSLGQPALINGDGSWEFHLALPLTERDKLICQYLVTFDADERLESAAWRRPQCADLIADASS